MEITVPLHDFQKGPYSGIGQVKSQSRCTTSRKAHTMEFIRGNHSSVARLSEKVHTIIALFVKRKYRVNCTFNNLLLVTLQFSADFKFCVTRRNDLIHSCHRSNPCLLSLEHRVHERTLRTMNCFARCLSRADRFLWQKIEHSE